MSNDIAISEWDLIQANSKGYKEGIVYALEYLSDLYDGIEETDIWKEYIKENN